MDSEEDDINELLALVEENEEEEEADEAETSTLEEEYLELERKMKEVREKMKQKSGSPKSTSPSQNHLKTTKNDEKKEQIAENPSSNDENKPPKSSFLAAFANAPFATSSIESLSTPSGKNIKSEPSDKKVKRQAERSPLSELPPQKKRRVANADSQVASSHPFTEKLRNVPPNTQTSIASKNTNSVAKNRGQVANEPIVVETEHFSRIRMKKCHVSNEEMKNRMQGKRFLKLGLIRSTMKISEETDWVTIGVVAKQLDREAAKNGKPFGIWNITDLEDCTKTIAFFLFGTVYEKMAKQIGIGSVVGVLNPTIMPPKKDDAQNAFDNTPALTVDVAERIMHIGLSTDLGWCTATKWRNNKPAGKCLAFINKNIADVCVFHMKAKYKKSSARRSELQGSVAAPVAQKFKNSLWNKVKNDQFFYGGKTYSASPTSAANKHKPTEPKVKLTKFLTNHQSLAVEGKKELMERSKVMRALSGIEDDHSVSGCSPAFAEMLASGDNVAGSRQYLNHLNNLKRDIELKKKVTEGKTQTAAELLKEQGNLLKSRKVAALSVKQAASQSPKPSSLLAQLKKNANTPKPSYVSSNDIKKMTAEMVKAKKMQLSKITSSPKLGGAGPKLGQGDKSNDIDLFGDWSAPKKTPQKIGADLAKRKAIAKLRTDAGDVSIKKKDPNRGVLKQIKNVQSSDKIKSKILQKVSENRCDIEENQENVVQKSPENSKYGKLSKTEFDAILNSQSTYQSAVESSQLQEEENYFTPLIRKEMMEQKMSETFEIQCKIVTCAECRYTFWGPHDRCKELRHHLNWKNAKKKFYQCSKCKHRTTTWETYPSKPCVECGSEKNWQKTSMLKERDVKILDAEVLLIRGLEHGRFLNTLA